MTDLHELLRWWKKESRKSQKDLHPAIYELGKRLIEAQISQQEQAKAQEERRFQREQKLFRQVDLCQRRLKTLEERLEILVEIEVETQKIVFSDEVDKQIKAHQKIFLETVGTMLQSFQEILRDLHHLPKGEETVPKA